MCIVAEPVRTGGAGVPAPWMRMTSRPHISHTPPRPVDGSAVGVIECVEEFRKAVVANDVDLAQSLRWLAPRPPGERDLLSDMAAATGIGPAIGQLAKFWRQAQVRTELVRGIDGHQAELYERLTLPNDSLPIVTLVRRDRTTDPWRVVCMQEASDERFVIWVAVHADEIDDVEVSLALPIDNGGQLIVDNGVGVLGHEERSWLAHVRGPFVPDRWPESLPGEGGRIVELSSGLSSDPKDRSDQLDWLLGTVRVFTETLDGAAAYMVPLKRVLMPAAIDAIVTGQASPSQALRFWANIEEGEGFVHTDGLRLLGLPEVEMRTDLFVDPALSRDLTTWLAEVYVSSRQLLALGTELVVGDESRILVAGRRGPRRGKSYGRAGAVRVAELSEFHVRGSRSRMRVPDEISMRR